ncbi:hypothetical protein Tco_0514006 [Tanacetum coccineum]
MAGIDQSNQRISLAHSQAQATCDKEKAQRDVGFALNTLSKQTQLSLKQIATLAIRVSFIFDLTPVEREHVEREPVEREPVEQEPVEREPVDQEPVEQEPGNYGDSEFIFFSLGFECSGNNFLYPTTQNTSLRKIEKVTTFCIVVEHEPMEQEPVEQEPVTTFCIVVEPVEREHVEREPVEWEPVEREPVEQEPVEQEPVEREHKAYEI